MQPPNVDSDDFWDSTVTFHDIVRKQKEKEDNVSLNLENASKVESWTFDNLNDTVFSHFFQSTRKSSGFYRQFRDFPTCITLLDTLLKNKDGDEVTSLLAYLYKNTEPQILMGHLQSRPPAVSHLVRYLKKFCHHDTASLYIESLSSHRDAQNFLISRSFAQSGSPSLQQVLIGHSLDDFKKAMLTEAQKLAEMSAKKTAENTAGEMAAKKPAGRTVGEMFRSVLKCQLLKTGKVSGEEVVKVFGMSSREVVWAEARVYAESANWDMIVQLLYDHKGKRKLGEDLHERVSRFVMGFDPPHSFQNKYLI